VNVLNIDARTAAAGYDTLSRVDALTRPSSTSAISYDPADRMTRLAHTLTTGAETWTLAFTDGGQLATSTSSNAAWDWHATAAAAVATVPNGLNQNASVGGTTWTYDKDGNLTSDGTRSFTYDPENRLLTESGPVSMTLSYDPTGRLQQSVIGTPAVTTNFLYDGDALVEEYSASGTVLRRYVHGPQVDNLLIWYEGSPMATTNANYLVADRQGSIAAKASNAGEVNKNYAYDPYGAPDAWDAIGTDPRFRYTGQIAIPEAQLYYYKARVYDPAAGKFLQTDPVGDAGDLNFYAYVSGDPIANADPAGTCPIVMCGAGGSVGPAPDGGAPDTQGVIDQDILSGTVARTGAGGVPPFQGVFVRAPMVRLAMNSYVRTSSGQIQPFKGDNILFTNAPSFVPMMPGTTLHFRRWIASGALGLGITYGRGTYSYEGIGKIWINWLRARRWRKSQLAPRGSK
jgi:RHS repeat-associated protein